MKKEFNIGDRVKKIAGRKGKGEIGKIIYVGNIGKLLPYVALVQFDNNIGGHDGNAVIDGVCGKSGYCWWCKSDELELIEPAYKLIFKGNETILIKDGKEYVSKCADGDAYDKEKGLLLCLAKANGVSYSDLRKMIYDAEDENEKAEKKAVDDLFKRIKAFVEAGVKALKDFDNVKKKLEDDKAEKTVKEVKRPAKVGEYIKIFNATYPYGTYKNGDILKVYKIDGNGVYCETKNKLNKENNPGVRNDNGNVVITINEYVVLENYKPYKITLSEFWKSEYKLAIHCENNDDVQKLLNLMRKRGFCHPKNKKGDGEFNNVTNEKNLFCVDINTVGDGVIANEKTYNLSEVDLNN